MSMCVHVQLCVCMNTIQFVVKSKCICVCVRACVCACVCACVRACVKRRRFSVVYPV